MQVAVAAEASAESGGSSSAAASSERLRGGEGEAEEEGDEDDEAADVPQPLSIGSRLAAHRMTSALREGRERSSSSCCLLPCRRWTRSTAATTAADLFVLNGIDVFARLFSAILVPACFALARGSKDDNKDCIAIAFARN